MAFSGAVICHRDFLFEGVTSEKCLEPVVGCEYRAEDAAAKNMVSGWRCRKPTSVGILVTAWYQGPLPLEARQFCSCNSLRDGSIHCHNKR